MSKMKILALSMVLTALVFDGGDTRMKRNTGDVEMTIEKIEDKYGFETNFYDVDVIITIRCGVLNSKETANVVFVSENGTVVEQGTSSYTRFNIPISKLQIGSYHCVVGNKISKKLEIYYKMCSDNCVECVFDKDGKCSDASDFCILTATNSKFKCGSIFNEALCAKANGRFCPSEKDSICADPNEYNESYFKVPVGGSCGRGTPPQMRLIRGNKTFTLLYDDTSFLYKGDIISISLPSGNGIPVSWEIKGLNNQSIDNGTATCDENGMCSIKIDDTKFSNHYCAKFQATTRKGRNEEITMAHKFIFYFKPIEPCHAVFTESDSIIRFTCSTSLVGSAGAPFKLNALFLGAAKIMRFDVNNDWKQKWDREGHPNSSTLPFLYELCGYSVRGRECMNFTDVTFNLVVQTSTGNKTEEGKTTGGKSQQDGSITIVHWIVAGISSAITLLVLLYLVYIWHRCGVIKRRYKLRRMTTRPPEHVFTSPEMTTLTNDGMNLSTKIRVQYSKEPRAKGPIYVQFSKKGVRKGFKDCIAYLDGMQQGLHGADIKEAIWEGRKEMAKSKTVSASGWPKDKKYNVFWKEHAVAHVVMDALFEPIPEPDPNNTEYLPASEIPMRKGKITVMQHPAADAIRETKMMDRIQCNKIGAIWSFQKSTFSESLNLEKLTTQKAPKMWDGLPHKFISLDPWTQTSLTLCSIYDNRTFGNKLILNGQTLFPHPLLKDKQYQSVTSKVILEMFNHVTKPFDGIFEDSGPENYLLMDPTGAGMAPLAAVIMLAFESYVIDEILNIPEAFRYVAKHHATAFRDPEVTGKDSYAFVAAVLEFMIRSIENGKKWSEELKKKLDTPKEVGALVKIVNADGTEGFVPAAMMEEGPPQEAWLNLRKDEREKRYQQIQEKDRQFARDLDAVRTNTATPEQRARVNSRVKEDRRRVIEERSSVRSQSNTRQRDQSYSRQETAQSNRTAVSQPKNKYWSRSYRKKRGSNQSMGYRE